MRKSTKVALWTIFGIALLAAPFVGMTKWHDYQLVRLQNEVASLPHPASSKLLAQHGKIGNFGNGDHLDYWAVEVRTAPNPRAASHLYQGMRVPVPNAERDDYSGVKNGTQPVEIAVLPSPLPANYNLKVGYYKWNLNALASRSGLYTVEVVNSGENNSLDALLDGRGN